MSINTCTPVYHRVGRIKNTRMQIKTGAKLRKKLLLTDKKPCVKGNAKYSIKFYKIIILNLRAYNILMLQAYMLLILKFF